MNPITNLAELREALECLELASRGRHPSTIYLEPPLRLRLAPNLLTDGSITLDVRVTTEETAAAIHLLR